MGNFIHDLNTEFRSILSEKTQNEISKSTKISSSAISLWKRGIDFSYKQLIKLAVAYNYSINVSLIKNDSDE
jgi:transcriptional regulator with XRE-family HTH domain